MIDPADKAQRAIRRYELRLWMDASSSISVLKKLEDELALLDYIDRLEAERDALRKELDAERIRARQYQVRAENDA